jgi:hypothetical protein
MGWFGNRLSENSAATEAIHSSAIENIVISVETAELIRIFQQRRSSGYRRINDEHIIDIDRPLICIEVEQVIRILAEYVDGDHRDIEGVMNVIAILEDDFRAMLACCSNGQKVVSSIRKLKHKYKDLNLQFIPPVEGNDHVVMEQRVSLELRFICTKLKEAIITLDTIRANIEGDKQLLAAAIEKLMRYTLIALRLDTSLTLEIRTKLQEYLPSQTSLQPIHFLEA